MAERARIQAIKIVIKNICLCIVAKQSKIRAKRRQIEYPFKYLDDYTIYLKVVSKNGWFIIEQNRKSVYTAGNQSKFYNLNNLFSYVKYYLNINSDDLTNISWSVKVVI